jgi:alpha,alpha-trehalase
MYEKFSNLEIDSAGGGGEYTVQVYLNFLFFLVGISVLTLLQDGFGWTNGVALWIASNYGPVLSDPQCPALVVATKSSSAAGVRLPYAAVVLSVVVGVVQLL